MTSHAVGDRQWTIAGSPVGELLLACEAGALTAVLFADHKGVAPDVERWGARSDTAPLLLCAKVQLAEYFDGVRQVFELPVAPEGTAFQQRVWAQLREIPYAATISYGEVTRRLGLPIGSARAVGLANGSNPVSIIIACHRVIGADGSLTGYGGGLQRKRFLLDLESAGTLF